MIKLFSEWFFLKWWVWLVLQLELTCVAPRHAPSSVPGWSCFMSARAQGLWAAFWTLTKFRYRILCLVQLYIYITLAAEGVSCDLWWAAHILFAFEVPRHTLWYSVGTKYAQMETNVTAHDHRHGAVQMYPLSSEPSSVNWNGLLHNFTGLYSSVFVKITNLALCF